MSTDTSAVVHAHEAHSEESNWEGGESPFKVSYGKLMMWYFLLSDAFTFAGFLIAYGTLRFSSPSWPVPDFVFRTAPFDNLGMGHSTHLPLIFVTFMSFLLIVSSVTMVRAVQEGHRENKNGVVFWMLLTVIGGAGFLGCQAWEWSNLIGAEHMSVTVNPFGTHTEAGTYTAGDGHEISSGDTFQAGDSYLIHQKNGDFDQLPYTTASGESKVQSFGPKAFGALFFFITGFHGFHVFSGVLFLIIIMLNAASGLYVERKNGYEMVEKIGLYWHFVDLVWVFVFLVFYLL